MCPLFLELDEIYGEKINFQPPHVHDSSLDLEINITASVEDEDSQIPEVPGPDSTETSAQKFTSALPKSFPQKSLLGKRRQPDSGMTALAEAAKFRFEIQKEELALSREKWEDDKKRKDQDHSMKLEQMEASQTAENKRLELEKVKMQNEMEIAKYRIDQECKVKLELGKLQYKAE